MRKSINTRRVMAAGLSVVLSMAAVPDGTYAALAAAKKPAIASKATVLTNGTKALAITKNGYTITKVTWKTSKKAVAQVAGTKAKGTVYGVKAGTAKITATVKAKKGGKTKTFTIKSTVTVKAPSASLAKKSLKVGGTTTVKVANAPAKATITYASANKAVATVTKAGKVTAVKAGTAKITAKVVLPKTKYAKKATKTLNAGTVTVTGAADTSTATAVPTAAATATPAVTATPAAVTPEATPDPAKATTVKTQAELDAALKNNEPKVVTIGDFTGTMTIASGTYDKISLLADAPNGTITNNGTFQNIEIKAVANNTWNENGKGNKIKLSNDKPIHFVLTGQLDSLTASGTAAMPSKIEFKGSSTVGNFTIQNTGALNVTAEGTSRVEKVAVAAAAKLDLKTTGSSEVKALSVEAAGADLDLTAGENSKFGTIEITEKAASADGTEASKQTKVDVRAEGSAKINTITTSAANAPVSVISNGGSEVGTLKISGAGSAEIAGDSKNVTTLDVKDASEKAKVTVRTDTVKVEVKEGVNKENIINNQSGKELETTVTKNDGTTEKETTKQDASDASSNSSSSNDSTSYNNNGSTKSVTGVELSIDAPKVGDRVYAKLKGTNVSSIAREDLTYAWYTVAGNGTEDKIDGEDADSLKITDAVIGNKIKVEVKYKNGEAKTATTTSVVAQSYKIAKAEGFNAAEAHGDISFSADVAKEGDVITVTVTPAEGYGLSALTYQIGTNTPVAINHDGTAYSFKMPAENVTVQVTFKLDAELATEVAGEVATLKNDAAVDLLDSVAAVEEELHKIANAKAKYAALSAAQQSAVAADESVAAKLTGSITTVTAYFADRTAKCNEKKAELEVAADKETLKAADLAFDITQGDTESTAKSKIADQIALIDGLYYADWAVSGNIGNFSSTTAGVVNVTVTLASSTANASTSPLTVAMTVRPTAPAAVVETNLEAGTTVGATKFTEAYRSDIPEGTTYQYALAATNSSTGIQETDWKVVSGDAEIADAGAKYIFVRVKAKESVPASVASVGYQIPLAKVKAPDAPSAVEQSNLQAGTATGTTAFKSDYVSGISEGTTYQYIVLDTGADVTRAADNAWKDVVAGNNIAVTAGQKLYVRVKATTTLPASAASGAYTLVSNDIAAKAPAAPGSVAVGNLEASQTIVGATKFTTTYINTIPEGTTYQYALAATNSSTGIQEGAWKDVDGNDIENAGAKYIFVRVKAKDNVPASAASGGYQIPLTKVKAPNAPSAVTSENLQRGTADGTTAFKPEYVQTNTTYQYAVLAAGADVAQAVWHDVSTSNIEVTAGQKLYVRVKATTTLPASAASEAYTLEETVINQPA